LEIEEENAFDDLMLLLRIGTNSFSIFQKANEMKAVEIN